MTPQPRPNHRWLAAARLTENTAMDVAIALLHIANEWPAIDGIGGGAQDDGSRSTGDDTTVERAAMGRERLQGYVDELADDVKAIASIAASAQNTCRKIIGTRDKIEVPRCTANPGFEGYNTPLSEGGWHDPTCTGIPRSRTNPGLCDACRKRYERWRIARDIKALDPEPVDFESEVYYVDTVAHVRPIHGAA